MAKKMNIANAMVWAYSGLSHMYKEQNTFFPRVLTFPGETIEWVGQATAGAFGTFSGGAKAVDIGISPYRLVFGKTGGVENRCRSFWFEVDFEDWLFEYKKGMLTKLRRFYGFKLSEPRTNKGLTHKFEFDVLGKLESGELVPFHITHEFSHVKGFNPQTRKFKRNLAENVFQAIEEGYQNQKPVSIEDLFIFFFDHTRFDELTFALPQDAKTDPPKPSVPSESIAEPINESQCPACGKEINPDAKFCGACGEPLTPPAQPKDSAAGLQEEGSSPAPDPEPVAKDPETEPADPPQAPPGQLCPSCGEPAEEDWALCPYCATPLESSCPACGKDVEPDWLACPYCGERLKEN